VSLPLSWADGTHDPVMGISHLILQQRIESGFLNPLTSHEGQECVRCYWLGRFYCSFPSPAEILLGSTAREIKYSGKLLPSPIADHLRVGGNSALWVL